MTDLATRHWQLFTEFCQAELASGGPDPQVELTGRAAARHPQPDVAAGWFVAPYTCGAAAALWHWMDVDDEVKLQQLLLEHQAGLPTRRERRVIWGRDQLKLARCLLAWRRFALEELPGLRSAPYDELYRAVNNHALYFGRYATMKVIEVLYQAGRVENPQTDLRANGAKFPRRALALLYPQHAERLNSKSNDRETLAFVDRVASAVKEGSGVETWFDFETLCCNFRQSLSGKYPGRSHDRELAHWIRAEAHFGADHLNAFLPFYELRQALFPVEYLGEHGAPPWTGARPELEVATKERITRALAD